MVPSTWFRARRGGVRDIRGRPEVQYIRCPVRLRYSILSSYAAAGLVLTCLILFSRT